MLADYPGDENSDGYYWPPGTSYVLAVAYELAGAGRVAARVTMILISVATVAATVLLARRLLGDRRMAWTAGWVIALVPSAVFMPSQPFSFDVTMLGVTLAVLGVLAAYDRGQARWLAGAGLALGVAVAARPGAITVLAALVPIAVVALVHLRRRGEGRRARTLALGAVAFAICLAAPVVPALVHHADVDAGLTLSTNNEGNLLFGNNPYTRDYKTWHQGQHDFSEFPPDEEAWLERHFVAGGTLEQREEMREEALDYIVEHPGVTALRTVNRARAFWGFDYTYANGLRAEWGALPTPVVAAAGLIEVGGWILLGILVLAGLILGRGLFQPSRLTLLVLVVVAYELPHLVAFSGGRWHLPVLALLAPAGAAGVHALGSPREAPRRLLASRPLLVAVALFLLVQAEYAYFVATT